MMRLLLGLLAQLLHAIIVLAAAPLLAGFSRSLTARLAGRTGPPLLQPWRDLWRHAVKQPVLAENVSPFFRAAPAIAFAAIGAAAMLVPSFTLGMAATPAADLLVIAGLLLAARLVLALAALDTGTAIGGMGASRTSFVAACAEPALLTIIFAFAAAAGSSSLGALAATGENGRVQASLALALPALLCVACAGGGNLHAAEGAVTETGMGQAALALEYSGRALALVEGAAALQRLVWLSLIVVLFFPFGVATADASPGAWLPALAVWLAKLCLLAAASAALEASLARMRLARVPALLGLALLLALLAAALVLAGQAAA